MFSSHQDTHPEGSDTSNAPSPERLSRHAGRPSIPLARLYLPLLTLPWLTVLALRAPTRLAGFLSLNKPYLYLILALITASALLAIHHLFRAGRKYEVLRECEQLLFSRARDGMLLVRVLGGKDVPGHQLSFIVAAENPAAVARLNSFGQASTYVGRGIDTVFPEWLYEKTREIYSACVSTKQAQRYEVCLPDGTLTHESIATPVLDGTGSYATHIIVIMRDVGERLKHERELRDALQKAEAANKSKSEFLASMSHELRTPLNAVLGYSELLTHGIGGPLGEKQTQYVEYIHKSGSHLLKIIADILDLSKIEAGQFVLYEEVAEIGPLIDVCMLMIRERAAAKGLSMIEDYPELLPAVRVDVLRMKQVILNLLSNAVKFTGSGSVTLSVRHDTATGLTIAISDTGIGMAQGELAVALEPFGQVESAFTRNHDGTGLGLPIARHLVELHGGQLQISSQQGEGTIVAITIPPERIVGVAISARVA